MSLIAYYNLNENTSNSIVSDSANSYNGVLKNNSDEDVNTSVVSVSGIQNNAFHFDENKRVDITTNPLYDISATKVSISTWIYVKNSDFNNDYKVILDTANGGGGANDGFYLIVDDRGNPNATNGIKVFFDTTGGGYTFKADNIFSDSRKWYHIVIFYENGTVKLYINNSEISHDDLTTNNGDYNPDNNPLCIGSLCIGHSNYFSGYIDEVRIYNSILTEEDINDLYNLSYISSGGLFFGVLT